MNIESKAADRTALEAKTQEFLRNGGTITRCAPGPSENVVRKHTMRGRPRARTDGVMPQPIVKPQLIAEPQLIEKDAPSTDP